MKFSPSPTTPGSPYQMIGYRMLAATTFEGQLNIFRIDHSDDGTNPRPANVQQLAANNTQVPILGMTWQADAVAILLACADNTIKKFDVNTQKVDVIG